MSIEHQGTTSKNDPRSLKKRKRKRSFIATPYQRRAVMVVAIVATVFVSIHVIRSLKRPYNQSAQQALVLEQKKAQLELLNAENDQLDKEQNFLSKSDGKEAAARSQGYLKPGEKSLIIESTPRSGSTEQ